MRREFDYRLAEEDYRNWIHWSLTENPRKNRKIMAVVLFLALTAFVMSSGYRAAQGDITKLIPNIVIVLITAAVLYFGMSQKHQEKLIWKRSGLERLKMRDEFPSVHLTVEDGLIRVDAAGQGDERHTSFSYKEIFEVREIERLVLLRTEKAWQFIAKSGFADEAEKDEFVRFIKEKIADAAEHPENYPTEKELAQRQAEQEAAEKAEERERRIAAGEILPEETKEAPGDAPQITRVDTSRMGSIGRLAHMVTADVEDIPENTPEEAPEEEKAESAGEMVPEEEAAERAGEMVPEEEPAEAAEKED